MYEMQGKIKTKKNKTKTRNSIECYGCVYNKNCKSKYGLFVFETNNNVEVDCWLKKVSNFLFFTGFHRSTCVRYKGKIIHKWIHVLDKEFDIFEEFYVDN